MTRILLLITTIAFSLSAGAEVDSYRSYLKTIDEYNRLFRVGSYQLKDGKVIRDFDLFYHRSHKRPDGTQTNRFSLPPSFDLYCIWKDDAGQWVHKEVLGLTIDTFDAVDFKQVASATEDELLIDLIRTEGPRKTGKPIKAIPLHFTLKFSGGNPVVTAKPNQGEQGSAHQSTTRSESESE